MDPKEERGTCRRGGNLEKRRNPGKWYPGGEEETKLEGESGENGIWRRGVIWIKRNLEKRRNWMDGGHIRKAREDSQFVDLRLSFETTVLLKKQTAPWRDIFLRDYEITV